MFPKFYVLLVSILAVAALNLGIYLALKKVYAARHSVDGELQIFRYRPIVAWAYIVGPPSMGVVAFLLAYGPTLSPVVDSAAALAISALAVGLLTLVGIWYRSFSITVDRSCVSTRSIFRRRTAKFSDVQKILVTGYPSKTLVVIDNSGRRVLSAYGDLQDFGDLIYLLKSKTAGYQVEARIKDKWGKWSAI
jgi:hypothetical protein